MEDFPEKWAPVFRNPTTKDKIVAFQCNRSGKRSSRSCKHSRLVTAPTTRPARQWRRAHRQGDRAGRPVLAPRGREPGSPPAASRSTARSFPRPRSTSPPTIGSPSTASRCRARAHAAVSLSQAARPGDHPRDPEGRPTIFARLPKHLPRLISVGRLDINTEGLLLLTNDGGLARALELPATGWLRRYRVRAHGKVTQAQLDALRDGVTVDGMHYGPIEATLDRQQGSNVWITFAMREGKNREVRNVLGASRARGQPPDPRVVRAVSARRFAGGRGRGGADAASARAARRADRGRGGRGFFRADQARRRGASRKSQAGTSPRSRGGVARRRPEGRRPGG